MHCTCQVEHSLYAEDFSMKISKERLTAFFLASQLFNSSNHCWGPIYLLLLNRLLWKNDDLSEFLHCLSTWMNKSNNRKGCRDGEKWLCALGHCFCSPVNKSTALVTMKAFMQRHLSWQVHQEDSWFPGLIFLSLMERLHQFTIYAFKLEINKEIEVDKLLHSRSMKSCSTMFTYFLNLGLITWNITLGTEAAPFCIPACLYHAEEASEISPALLLGWSVTVFKCISLWGWQNIYLLTMPAVCGPERWDFFFFFFLRTAEKKLFKCFCIYSIEKRICQSVWIYGNSSIWLTAASVTSRLDLVMQLPVRCQKS